MKKVLKLRDLDCANCANKIEHAISKLPNITSVSVSFMMQKIVVDYQNMSENELVEKIEEVIKNVEPDCQIVK